MALWTQDGFVADRWTTLLDIDLAPETGAIIVTAPRWSAEEASLSRRADPVGVLIGAGKNANAELKAGASRPLVALSFAKFADGRAFSYAQLLRQRFGFTGELRASGDVLIDEIPLMLRCGFTSFEITNEPTLRALKRGDLPGGKLYYQPSLAPHEAPAGTRPWLRRQSV